MGLEICNDGHGEICFDGFGYCPACLAIEEMELKVKDLEKELELLATKTEDHEK